MKQHKASTWLAAISAAILCVGQAGAADVSGKEKSFIKDALESSMAETKLGEAAEAKATRPDVKAFAKMIVEHHSASTADLKKLATAKGVTFEDALSLRHSAAVDKLNKQTGTEFDKDFLDQMVSNHEKAVKEFEDASKDAKDPDVKALIDKMLPVLRGHLDKARSLQGK